MKIKKFIALAMAACRSFSMVTSVFAENEVGTSVNPEVLDELDGDTTVTIPGGTDVYDEINYEWSQKEYEPYYYSYTVPNDVVGTVHYTFSVDEVAPPVGDEEPVHYIMQIKNLTTELETEIDTETVEF